MMKRIHLLFIMLVGCCAFSMAQHSSTRLMVVHTSDTHSCIEPISPNFSDPKQANKGGFMRRKVLIDSLRNVYSDNLLLLDCGDFCQGSAYFNLFKGEVEVKLMNLMRYDACTIGNHEFDFGLENLAKLYRMAQFPVVCCNYDFTGTPCEGLVKPYIVIERAGVRIGVFGVSPQLEGLVAKQNYAGTKFVDPASAAQPVIDKLRNDEHCDLVICLSHLGWGDEPQEDKAFIHATTGVDIVLGGHTHTYFEHSEMVPDANGHQVMVEHMGKNGRFVGTMELEVGN